MGYDITRFDCEIDEVLMCSICYGVLEDPLHATQCEHAFCKSCINEWLTRQPSCPLDRQFITTNLLKPPRVLRVLLSRLMIKCDYAHFGCTTVVQLERLVAHEKECEHNPKRPVPCDLGCGLVIPVEDAVEDVTRWVNSLQRAQVINWGYLYANPRPVTCAMVRAALYDSGCPAHTAAKLMENAGEGGWPAGLRTILVRHQNRQYYGNYVFRRIPGIEGVVVMAVDNPHMNNDFVLVPGHVMLFQCGGIE